MDYSAEKTKTLKLFCLRQTEGVNQTMLAACSGVTRGCGVRAAPGGIR